MTKMKCELCKKEIDQRNSHNGQPLVNGRVCSDCNYKVIMARLKEAEKAKEKKSSTENVETIGTGGQVNITDPMKNFEEYAKKFEETFILGKQPVRKENPENKVKEEKGGFTGEVEGLDKEKTLEGPNPIANPGEKEKETHEANKETKSAHESIDTDCYTNLFKKYGLKTVGDLKRFLETYSDLAPLEKVFGEMAWEAEDFEVQED